MKEIRGDAKSIRTLLAGAKYTIDYYQREYRWEKKHITELLQDLAEKFLESHEPSNERSAVERYGHYFLGSIIISDKEGQKFIIDGQQRLTSLTLLLIFIYNQLADDEQKGLLSDLIFSKKYGKRSFNLDVPARTACMEALFTGITIEENGQAESVLNILRRYQDIEDTFPGELRDDALPFFADWLIENVHLVEITAYTDADAYTIFETMNDRGLSLTPTDMLKGYLLANIEDQKLRNGASSVWRQRLSALQALGKEEESDAIKAWLRSQFAQTIRERKENAVPRDFDLIGTEFHRWVRDHEEQLGLSGNSAFANFIKEDFAFYTRWYEKIRQATEKLTPGLETVHYNAQNNFTLQYPVLLAPLCRTDSESEGLRKIQITAIYLDILIARRMWNWRAIDYSSMQYAMFLVMREIRGKAIAELAATLTERLTAENEDFTTNDRFRLHGTNGKQIHRLLARMTDYVETRSGLPSRYHEYIRRGGKDGFEIEHIWADHPERHTDEFAHHEDFKEYRNRIGGLLLLPKQFNASYGDLPYPEKREHYIKQNLMAQSLHEGAYAHNPGFRKFIENTGLVFRAHDQFKKEDLDTRQTLYGALAQRIWDHKKLLRIAG